ncbi:MAG: flippase-like domain-containing protein [Candidatus Omnitrophica bacterium]|nr:flippase-like domain-containing protein [Candidatus Omnitrophota bacterium]
MKLKTKTIISAVTLLTLVALFIYYLKTNISDFKQLTLVSPYLLIVLIIIFVSRYFIISQISIILLKQLSTRLFYKEAYALSVITGFYNLITPFLGGIAARAVYLKKKHKFPYVNFLATLSASYILLFLFASFMGVISTLLIYLSTETFPLIIFLIFNGIFLVLLFTVILSPKLKERKNKWLNRFIEVINGWHLIKDNKKVVLSVAALLLVQLLLSSLMLFLQFKIFGIDIGFTKVIFLISIGTIGMILTITPANLGIDEAIIVFSASTIGITPAQALAVALLGRAISLVVLFILGPIFSYTLIKSPQKQKTK